ncbi:Uncharacterised protein [Burkholderia pseudomallei]|nr:Uncharacterised protein [Burkholderia pseudomallei]
MTTTENSRADALTDDEIDAIYERVHAEWEARNKCAPNLWVAFARAILAASPVEQPAAAPIPEDCDVRNILLDVVPGEDGEGQEVYARNIADVERLLSEMGEKLDAVDAAKQPAPSPADERAAKISDYLNAPGMWAQVYCCAVFVRGWPSDMARSAADEAAKEFGDAACKTVADLTHTLDEVLRVD